MVTILNGLLIGIITLFAIPVIGLIAYYLGDKGR